MVAYSDAVTIIGDLDELEAAVLDDNGDGGGACVEAVLHELLHRRDRPLDDLPSRNPVNHWLVKPPDPRRLGHARGPRRDGLAHRHRRPARFSDLHRPSTVPGFQVIRFRGFGFRMSKLGFRVQDFEFWVRFRVLVIGFGCNEGFGFRIYMYKNYY